MQVPCSHSQHWNTGRQADKKLSRFNILYADKINVIKNLYKLLIKAEKALDLFLSQMEPVDADKNKEFKNQAVLILNNFSNYFEEKEIQREYQLLEK